MLQILKKIRHELYYVRIEDLYQIIIFLVSIIPSFFYRIYILCAKKRVWLVCEDKMEARDNGFCFYRYLSKQSDILAYYAIDPKSNDYDKVKELGNAVKFGSVKHWVLYLTSEYNISSQKAGRPGKAVGYVLEQLGIIKPKFVFLQHGITLSKAEWLFYKNTKMKLFICGAAPEYAYVNEFFGYPKENVKYLGFSRFDDYFDCMPNKNQIVLMPSWREWIGSKNEFSNKYEDVSDFTKTEYYNKYQSLINNSELVDFLSENNVILYFYPHRNMQQFINDFSTPCKNIKIVSNKNSDIRSLLMESSLMITDYSSVALDFAYMKKPVVYYQFDEERFREAQYAEGYFSYRDSGLGEVVNQEDDVVRFIVESYNDNYRMSKDFENAHKNFFTLCDNENSKRIYDALKAGL